MWSELTVDVNMSPSLVGRFSLPKLSHGSITSSFRELEPGSLNRRFIDYHYFRPIRFFLARTELSDVCWMSRETRCVTETLLRSMLKI